MTPTTTSTTVVDPVCHMTIDPADAVGTTVYEGASYHFCSRACQTKFESAPALFVGKPETACSCCTGS